MSKFQQEWQTGNSLIGFPFSGENSDQFVPDDFIVDLRLFLTGTKIVKAFLSEIIYNHVDDTYSLSFSRTDTGVVVLQGTMSRVGNANSRAGSKQVISSAEKVCLFTPGLSWDTPSWGGADSWTKTFTSAEVPVSQDMVNPGPVTFRRIFIDGQVPDESLWPRGGIQKIIGGYNIGIGLKTGRLIGSAPDVFDISAIGGSGAGYPPQAERTIDYVATFNGQGPNQRGNFTIDALDCLRAFQPQTETDLIPSTVQLNSDCLPCCSCVEYRNSSRAIGRRSAKIKDLCDLLQQKLTESSTAYNIGVAAINRNRKPLAVVRNVRALGSSITFSVQSMSAIPIFVYVAMRIESSGYSLGSPSVSATNVMVIAGGPDIHSAVTTHRPSLPAMPYDVSENPLAGIPESNFSSAPCNLLVCVGERRTSVGTFPISAGGLVEVKVEFPTIAAAIVGATTPAGSVAAALPRLSFESLAVFGSSRSFACSADSYRVQVANNDVAVDEFEACELPFANDFTTILVE